MTKVKLGVAGAGVFGNFHASKITADPRAHLVGIFDNHLERAQALAKTYNCEGYDNLDEFLTKVDALVVATPAIAHGGVARIALLAGKHCLVEKPLAASPQSAQILCEIAEEKKLVLQAGHQERYIFKSMGLFDIKERPTHFEAVRIGLPSVRGADVSVTYDLMIHDLDLATLLFRSEPKEIKATRLAGTPDNPDAIEAEILYECGGRATFIASRASDERSRKTTIGYKSGTVFIDYISREFEDDTGFNLHKDFADRIKDPMQQATSDFISSIITGAEVAVPARDAQRAVTLAQKIDDASRT